MPKLGAGLSATVKKPMMSASPPRTGWARRTSAFGGKPDICLSGPALVQSNPVTGFSALSRAQRMP
jgi:hypothetical protein